MDPVSFLRQMGGAARLQDILRERARVTPDATAVSFLSYPGGHERAEQLSYRDLDRHAGAISSQLLQHAVPGDRVLLAHNPGLNFVEAFFGCLYAELVAVPLAPAHLRNPERVEMIAANAEAHVLLLTREKIVQSTKLHGSSSLLVLDSESLRETNIHHFQEPRSGQNPLAFLQYTSGSTGDPKGVMVHQRGLLANIAQICAACDFSASDVGISWLPHYHDMGLISMLLTPIYAGFPAILMSPQSFVQYPERWLRAISCYGGTYCGGPDIAYRHCVERVSEDLRDRFDLSSWRIAFCGAEPIHAETLRRFAQAFLSSGFRPTSFSPCYGLAEATVFVTASPPGAGANVEDFDSAALEQGVARPVEQGGTARSLVGCGFAPPETDIRIVDANGEELPEGKVGEVWASGPGLASGYWGNEKATRATFGATLPQIPGKRFLRTGDLGFFRKGQLFISGRAKDLIIFSGRNIAPQDLEWEAQASHCAVGQAAAFTVISDGTEHAAMVVEIKRGSLGADLSVVSTAIRRAVSTAHDAPLVGLALVRPGLVPRTTSGKVVRSQCRRIYLDGRLDILHHWQSRTTAPRNSGTLPETPWILRREIHHQPAYRLFCFPYSGGGAGTYASWIGRFGNDVEVCPIQIPGRETRLGEEPIRHIGPLLEQFEKFSAEQTDTPFVFFGYCMGADLAVAVAHHLQGKGLTGPRALILAAKHAPSRRPKTDIPTYHLDDKALLDQILRLTSLPVVLLENPIWLKRTLDLIRADFEFNEKLTLLERPPLDCPITVLGGRSDHWVLMEHLIPWREFTTGSFNLQMIDGPHLFILEQQDAILTQVSQQLALLKTSKAGFSASTTTAGASLHGALQCSST